MAGIQWSELGESYEEEKAPLSDLAGQTSWEREEEREKERERKGTKSEGRGIERDRE